MVHLKKIDKDNWLKAISLKVREDQNHFVASNAVSLAQLNFLPDGFHAQGIYADNEMVGFTLYGIDEEDGEYWMYRMMIDEKHQGKGYGKAAIHLVIDDIRQRKEERHKTLTLSYEPENTFARDLYTKMGFEEQNGVMVEGEQVARYTF
ncbi:GNAT family N-acetyltransferase [Jeotgalibacillus salarius]|uniref:GNAT family N-acetyltransferase n=1 Tax=Jeotgalibacillus salarius TaxID=546023 RepID=A0A4Y8LMW9_9BACL|nr:GNAT family N-acetyltransferase [Jeotgalibacillus salarius]TFE02093.1 GNAT family N-acetyltransferase [Jeotgalibacillus salarius]